MSRSFPATPRSRALVPALLSATLLSTALPAAARADATAATAPDIVVTATRPTTAAIENPPGTSASIDAGRIDTTINAINVEDTIKYLPSLVVRKRHIGDTQAPLATRTSGVGASARSLIYADGALLSALIGNNNSTASPRWGLVSPEEIARIDVLYGPFSAAYPGNSIGAVVSITTRMPDTLEGTVTTATAIQRFRQYGTADTLPARQVAATLGDKIGPLRLFLSANHVVSDSQPLIYVTALGAPPTAVSGVAVRGGYADVNRLGQPITVLGAAGREHQVQTTLKLKAAIDLTPDVRLSYVGALFRNATDAGAESYLRATATGLPVYSNAFSTNVYAQDQRHWSHSLSADGTGGPVTWQLIGTRYRYADDVQRVPTGLLPAANDGGAGTIARMDGTGWYTLDAKASTAAGAHVLSAGAHRDGFRLESDRYRTTDWRHEAEGAIDLVSRGRTRTDALWAQDAWTPVSTLTLTAGGRYEWWRARDGYNFALSPALAAVQPELSARRFSPKATLAWTPAAAWSLTGSFGQAWRFPTVSELYQAITTGPTITVPNPNLRPERARSEELALKYAAGGTMVRLSLFSEAIRDALLSQSAPLVAGSATLYSYVQNVDRVRTRGVELAFEQANLVPRVDVTGSVTLVDPRIRADAAFPAAIGKRPPQVPRAKATLVTTWRATDAIALTAAARYSSRSYATIDNSDPVANTYQGFASYLVVDLRARFAVAPHLSMAVGVDNLTDRRYFLFHPFPQRSVTAEVTYRL